MYPFLTLDDEAEIVHSERLEDGFHTMTRYLPSYRLEDVSGLSDAEVERYLEVIRSTAHLIPV